MPAVNPVLVMPQAKLAGWWPVSQPCWRPETLLQPELNWGWSLQHLIQKQAPVRRGCSRSWVGMRRMLTPAGHPLGCGTGGLLQVARGIAGDPQPVGSTWSPHKWGWQRPWEACGNRKEAVSRISSKLSCMPGRQGSLLMKLAGAAANISSPSSSYSSTSVLFPHFLLPPLPTLKLPWDIF